MRTPWLNCRSAFNRDWTPARDIMDMEYRILGPGDASLLTHVAPGVFDDELKAHLVREFLDDSRHHLVVAIYAGCRYGGAVVI